MRYASFSKRLNAYGWDMLIVQGAALILVSLFAPLPNFGQVLAQAPAFTTWTTKLTWCTIALSAVYNTALVAGPWQATFGKRRHGLRVVRADGGRLGLGQSAWRHTASGLSMLVGGLGVLPVTFTHERVALHDMLARTRVITEK